MTLSLSPETEQLIAEHMKQVGVATADELVRVALNALDRINAPAIDIELDAATWEAIDRSEEQYQRGEGMAIDEAFGKLQKKYTSR